MMTKERILLLRNDSGRAGSMAGRTLKKKIRESIVAILTRYGAERIAIFGSYARGEAEIEVILTSWSGLPGQKA